MLSATQVAGGVCSLQITSPQLAGQVCGLQMFHLQTDMCSDRVCLCFVREWSVLLVFTTL